MKISAIDQETLRRAADIADAQRDLILLAKRRSERGQPHRTYGAMAAAGLAVLALSLLTTVLKWS